MEKLQILLIHLRRLLWRFWISLSPYIQQLVRGLDVSGLLLENTTEIAAGLLEITRFVVFVCGTKIAIHIAFQSQEEQPPDDSLRIVMVDQF